MSRFKMSFKVMLENSVTMQIVYDEARKKDGAKKRSKRMQRSAIVKLMDTVPAKLREYLAQIIHSKKEEEDGELFVQPSTGLEYVEIKNFTDGHPIVFFDSSAETAWHQYINAVSKELGKAASDKFVRGSKMLEKIAAGAKKDEEEATHAGGALAPLDVKMPGVLADGGSDGCVFKLGAESMTSTVHVSEVWCFSTDPIDVPFWGVPHFLSVVEGYVYVAFISIEDMVNSGKPLEKLRAYF